MSIAFNAILITKIKSHGERNSIQFFQVFRLEKKLSEKSINKQLLENLLKEQSSLALYPVIALTEYLGRNSMRLKDYLPKQIPEARIGFLPEGGSRPEMSVVPGFDYGTAIIPHESHLDELFVSIQSSWLGK